MAKTISAKDLCSDISNILIHHYKGHTTEFAEAKAVEDAEELINAIRQEIIENACEWIENNAVVCLMKEEVSDFIEDFRKAMEDE